MLDKQEVGSKFKTWAKQCDSDNINPSLLKLPLKAAFQNAPPPKKKHLPYTHNLFLIEDVPYLCAATGYYPYFIVVQRTFYQNGTCK